MKRHEAGGTQPAAGGVIGGDAVILTGGKSSRMGTDKALLAPGGETLLERMLRALRPLFRRVHLSIDPARPYPGFGVPVIPDAVPGRGPLEGVRASLERLAAPALFAAVDLPVVSAPLARALWAAGTATARRGAMARWRGGLEPAFAVYSPALLSEIPPLLDGGAGLRGLAGLSGVAVLDLEDPVTRAAVFPAGPPDLEAIFTNLNTPADLEGDWDGHRVFRGKPGDRP